MQTVDFIHELCYADFPLNVVTQAKRCLLDLIGTAAGGLQTDTSSITRRYVTRFHQAADSDSARLMFDGRRASLPGAAFAGAMTIDSLDSHDGHVLTKGHSGVTVLPVLLALSDRAGAATTAEEFLTGLALGYEIATRAGIALHASSPDFHSSGAWNALAAAALGARSLRLSREQTRQALGTAEYYGPRSQIMRAVDHPSMVKDGSGWGALTGLSAALLAAEGFTGAPALTVESPATERIWNDLGDRWYINEQYFKAYPVCRWAQPAIEAALSLKRAHQLKASEIDVVSVDTFHEGVRLGTRVPASSDEAQYSLPFPVAAALVRGEVGAAEVTAPAFGDTEILRLSMGAVLREDAGYNSRFPAERWAHVTLRLRDGSELVSEPHIARGNPENPLSEAEIDSKYRALAQPVIGIDRAEKIHAAVNAFPDIDLNAFLNLLLTPIEETA